MMRPAMAQGRPQGIAPPPRGAAQPHGGERGGYLILHTVPERSYPVAAAGAEHAALNGETPGLAVELDNARGTLTPLFARPPLRARAELRDTDGTLLFAGVVQSVSMSATISVRLEA